MIDHVSFNVVDCARSRAFYVAALAPLGFTILNEYEGHVGFGVEVLEFWINEAKATAHVHVALGATDRKAVDAFYAAAVAAGGKANGAPGLRDGYPKDYYSAFVLDPDGNNLEAVCRRPA